jgi:hypothetical protein
VDQDAVQRKEWRRDKRVEHGGTYVRRPTRRDIADAHVLRAEGDEGVDGGVVVELDVGAKELAALGEAKGGKLRRSPERDQHAERKEV